MTCICLHTPRIIPGTGTVYFYPYPYQVPYLVDKWQRGLHLFISCIFNVKSTNFFFFLFFIFFFKFIYLFDIVKY